MKKFVFQSLAAGLLIAGMMVSCVPQKKYAEMEQKRNQCEEENSKLKGENESLTTLSQEQTAELDKLNAQVTELKEDTFAMGRVYRRLSRNYDQLNTTYELLLQKNKELLDGNERETRKILSELQKTQENLLKREDELNALEKELAAKRASLQTMQTELQTKAEELELKEQKVQELQAVLARKDSVVNGLRQKVAEALVGFTNQGLTVEQREGKVYVSLEEKLLFASGRFEVNENGKKALIELAKVLETTEDIDILIEGHTDSIPYLGRNQLKDNWDLSVKRATSIVRILVKNSQLDPARLTAAGRGEYHPVVENTTPEGRARNRRTEIILTPRLDELYQIIENQ